MAPSAPQLLIEDLPPEILGLVQDYLPLYEAIRLGLCSRRLKAGTDPRLWSQVRCEVEHDKVKGIKYVGKVDDDERWEFLKEIEPQVPQLELCHYCRIFHPRLNPGAKSLWRATSTDVHPVAECDVKEVQFARWGIDWGFGFRDVYAVMSHQLLSAEHGIPLSDLSVSTNWSFAKAYRNLHNASRSPFKRFLSYVKLDTQAVLRRDDLLVHRTQRIWVPIHLQGTDVLLRYGAGDIAGDFKICRHHGPQSGEMINNFTIPLREGIKYVLAAKTVFGSAEDRTLPRIIKRCEDCPTEYAITFHVHNENSVEIVLDVWQNLGSCQTPQAAGWLICWGKLNVRHCDIPETTLKEDWYKSGVGYVADATLFNGSIGKSEIDHASSPPILKEWEDLQKQVAAATRIKSRNVYLDVVPQLSKHHFEKIRHNYINARYEPGALSNRVPPPFHHRFKDDDGRYVHINQLRYTRILYTCKREAETPTIEAAPADPPPAQCEVRNISFPSGSLGLGCS